MSWLILLAVSLASAQATCSVGSGVQKAKANDSANYQALCISALEDQVRIEMEASLQYLMMAAYFLEDTVNLPKVAEMFFAMADEERSHGIAFVNYLRMRGATNNDFFGSQPLKPRMDTFKWNGVAEALQMSLQMEKDVSGRMKDMIDACSQAGSDDPHAADWLTGTWLEEQLTGQRQLAGHINTLNNFRFVSVSLQLIIRSL